MQAEACTLATALPSQALHKAHRAVSPSCSCGSSGGIHTVAPQKDLAGSQLRTTVLHPGKMLSSYWVSNAIKASQELSNTVFSLRKCGFIENKIVIRQS